MWVIILVAVFVVLALASDKRAGRDYDAELRDMEAAHRTEVYGAGREG